MERYPILILLIFSLFYPADGGVSAQEWLTVRWVNDGDTIVLEDGRIIRYIGINTPEIKHLRSDGTTQKAEAFGYKAKAFNKQMVFLKKVRIDFEKQKKDRYGRVLAHLFLEDGTFVNKRMVELGYAHCLWKSPNTKYSAEFLEAQHRAMQTGKGIWRDRHEEHGKYIGNVKSKRFHLITCTFGRKIAQKNRIIFSSGWEAFYQGYAPCGKCKM